MKKVALSLTAATLLIGSMAGCGYGVGGQQVNQFDQGTRGLNQQPNVTVPITPDHHVTRPDLIRGIGGAPPPMAPTDPRGGAFGPDRSPLTPGARGGILEANPHLRENFQGVNQPTRPQRTINVDWEGHNDIYD